MARVVKRGDIVLLDFNPAIGSEQKNQRPALIIQNNIGNECGNTTIVAPFTSQVKKNYPIFVFFSKEHSGLKKDSTLLLNQIRTVDKSRIIKKVASLDDFSMLYVDNAIKISLGLD